MQISEVIHDTINRAAQKGVELTRTTRPIDAGQIASAVTRPGHFIDPDIDPDTGYPVAPATGTLFYPGMCPGQPGRGLG